MPPLKDFSLEGKENFKEVPCNFNQEGPLEQCLWRIESREGRDYLSLQKGDERQEVRACLSQELGARSWLGSAGMTSRQQEEESCSRQTEAQKSRVEKCRSSGWLRTTDGWGRRRE